MLGMRKSIDRTAACNRYVDRHECVSAHKRDGCDDNKCRVETHSRKNFGQRQADSTLLDL